MKKPLPKSSAGALLYKKLSLQIILKVLRNLSDQMCPVGTSNIVAVAGIDKVV